MSTYFYLQRTLPRLLILKICESYFFQNFIKQLTIAYFIFTFLQTVKNRNNKKFSTPFGRLHKLRYVRQIIPVLQKFLLNIFALGVKKFSTNLIDVSKIN